MLLILTLYLENWFKVTAHPLPMNTDVGKSWATLGQGRDHMLTQMKIIQRSTTLTLYIETWVKVTAYPLHWSTLWVKYGSKGESYADTVSANRLTDHNGATAEKNPNKYCCFGGNGDGGLR